MEFVSYVKFRFYQGFSGVYVKFRFYQGFSGVRVVVKFRFYQVFSGVDVKFRFYQVFSRVCVIFSLLFCIVFCGMLFLFFICSLYCLSFFGWWHLITFWAPSNFFVWFRRKYLIKLRLGSRLSFSCSGS